MLKSKGSCLFTCWLLLRTTRSFWYQLSRSGSAYNAGLESSPMFRTTGDLPALLLSQPEDFQGFQDLIQQFASTLMNRRFLIWSWKSGKGPCSERSSDIMKLDKTSWVLLFFFSGSRCHVKRDICTLHLQGFFHIWWRQTDVSLFQPQPWGRKQISRVRDGKLCYTCA